MDVNIFDISIVIIILITALIGFMRGIVWMSVFIATWIAAIFLALKYKDQFAETLPIKLGSEIAQTGLAALLIFLGILIAGAILNAILHKLINAIGFGVIDRILGTGLGIVLGALATTLLTMLLGLTELPDQKSWSESKFIPRLQAAAVWLKDKMPADINQYIDETLGKASPISNTSTIDSNTTPSEPNSAELTSPSAN